jgi:hypothetical protein
MSTITEAVLRVGDWGEALVPTFEQLGYEFEPEVTKIQVVPGMSLGLAFFLWDEHTQRWWTCYYDGAAGDMHYDPDTDDEEWGAKCWKFWTGVVPDPLPSKYCPCERCRAEDDPIAWLEGVTAATDWGSWEWESYPVIPTVY